MHAGGVTTHASFEKFRAELLASRLEVKPDQMDYRPDELVDPDQKTLGI